jgi:hypothetical protein
MRNIALIDVVIRSKSTVCPQGQFSGCTRVHMGLRRNRSHDRNEKAAGQYPAAAGFKISK